MTGFWDATLRQRMSVTWMEIRSTLKRVPGARRLRGALYSTLIVILRSVYGDAYRQVVFRQIWIVNQWGDAESKSGTGSNLRETAVLRSRLASLLESLAVRRLLDIPCGDFHWMKKVRFPPGLVYEGGDIVEQIVDRNHRQYGGETRLFRTMDLLRDPLPAADLILCRDCLVHFSFVDIFTAVGNLKRSGSKYLLTTHYANDRANDDIRTGRWRPLNLTRPPFNFPPPLFVIDEECSEADGQYRDKRLALWRLEDLPDKRPRQSGWISTVKPLAKRILLVTAGWDHGGMEVVVARLAEALTSRGGEVRVVSMLPPTGFSDELEAAGIKVISLGMKAGRPNLFGILRFLSCVCEFHPDIIHAHMFHASILARLARVLTGIPVVCTIHSEIECSHRKTSARFREWIYRVTDAACSRTTAVSERIRQRYVREKIVPSHRIEVIDNGVDPERFRPCRERRHRTRTDLGWQDCFVWLAVGRLELAKDYPKLITAFQRVREQCPFSKLAIAGEGRLRPQIEHLIQCHELQGAVSLLGSRTDVPDLMNASDALVMCSAWEGGPLVLLEAGAMGRPVIATEVGAAPQIVLPGQTGLLVPPRDPAALAQAMTRMMMMESEKLAQMGLDARRHIMDRFSLSSVHSRYIKMYEEVLAVTA